MFRFKNIIKVFIIFIITYILYFLSYYKNAENIEPYYLKIISTLPDSIKISTISPLNSFDFFDELDTNIWGLNNHQKRAINHLYFTYQNLNNSFKIYQSVDDNPYKWKPLLENEIKVKKNEVTISPTPAGFSIIPYYKNTINWKGDIWLILIPFIKALITFFFIFLLINFKRIKEGRFGYIFINIDKYIWLLFIPILLYSFVLIFFGIDFADTFFYINMCTDYSSFPLMVLTLLIGKGWMSLFGDSLISFRILNWSIWILSIILPYFIVVPANMRKKNFKYLLISIILITVLNYNIFGGDSCTLLFLVLSTALVIKLYQTNRLVYLLLYGLFSALLILIRFSNILILPATLVIFGIIENNNKLRKLQKTKSILSYLKKISIFFLVCISFYILFNILVYGSFKAFTSKLIFSITNIDDSHGIMSMLKGYAKDSIKLFQYLVICIGIYIIAVNKLKLNSLIQKNILVISFILFIVFLNFNVGVAMYNWNLSILYSAIVYTILIILYIQEKKFNRTAILSILLVLSMIPILGSNTGLLKLSPFLIVLLPTLIASNKIVIQGNLNYFFVVLLLFVFYTRMEIVYEDLKITDLNYELKTSKISHIKTSEVKIIFIKDVLNLFKVYEKENKPILFYGRVSYIFYNLTNTKPLYLNLFWMLPDNMKDVKRTESFIINKRPVVFFTPDYPSEATLYFSNRKAITSFESMLIKNGYEPSTKKGFLIYTP